MKTPARPFKVEIKRRSKQLAEKPKASIWPEQPATGKYPAAADQRETAPAERVTPQDRQNAGPTARILPDLSSEGTVNPNDDGGTRRRRGE
ncbi:hypothetical protein [Mesorhizobium xinjiangense]|uniref:hypothetical protein n=1 Tax=Mesorhizobium xinjiangense TaxID=2678685 RepID=UPI0012EE9AF7|nr:hypothetical protein [Mesorhizobium xinjiangense]